MIKNASYDNITNIKIWDKENTKFYLLILYCITLTYFTPPMVSRIGFLPILYFVYRSKINAPWLVLLLILIDTPAHLFYGGMRDAVGRAPIYPIALSISITFTDLLIYLLIIKSLKKESNLIYKKENLIIGFVFILSFFTTFAFKIDLNSIFFFFRVFTFLILLICIPKILNNKKDWNLFFQLLFPIIFIGMISQIHVLFTGKPLAALLNSNITMNFLLLEVEEGTSIATRNLSAPIINFICYSSALALISSAKQFFSNKYYLYFIVVVSFMQIFLSATRGWFLAYSFMLIFGIIYSKGKQRSKIFILTFILLIIGFYFIQTSGIMETQVNNSIKRISSISDLATGGIIEGGNLYRIDTRLPNLLKRINKSLLLGFGFSKEARENSDPHVGLVNPIINFGIIGYILILFCIITYNLRLYTIHKSANNHNPFKGPVRFGIITCTGLFIIHSTSRQIFGINIFMPFNLIVPFVFTITNWFAVSALKYEHNLRNINYEN